MCKCIHKSRYILICAHSSWKTLKLIFWATVNTRSKQRRNIETDLMIFKQQIDKDIWRRAIPYSRSGKINQVKMDSLLSLIRIWVKVMRLKSMRRAWLKIYGKIWEKNQVSTMTLMAIHRFKIKIRRKRKYLSSTTFIGKE